MTSSLQLLVRRYGPLWPVINWGLFIIGSALIVGIHLGVIAYGEAAGVMGDGAAWYSVDTPYDWTDRPPGVAEYRYSPAFLWATAPLRLVTFEVYQALWTALHLAAIAWLGPWTIVLAFDDVVRGNINTFLAVGVVLAVHGHAWTWALPLLTKVTPGIGLLYHVGRGQWRKVATATGVTAAIVLVTWPFGLWQEWLSSLWAGPETYASAKALAPLPIRLALGGLLCVAAARWVWLLPMGMVAAMPGLWPSSLALLASLPKLLRSGHRTDHDRASTSQVAD